MPFTQFAGVANLQLQAATPLAGFALQNGTPNVLSWTPPADGRMHTIVVAANLDITSAETGGQVTLNCQLPDGSAGNPVMFPGGQSGTQSFSQSRTVPPGVAVTVQQTTALTVGAAVMFVSIWGA